jgi:tetraacyldisaccharide 4'-kinase
LLLLPFSVLFVGIAYVRRACYRSGLLRSHGVSKPVVVVGNLTAGGTGKTPFVVWLARELLERGHVPGVITRGYGGRSMAWPCDVEATSDPVQVGDEAVLIAEQTGGIVVAGPDRVRAAQRAIERGATIVISDDGLQHYRLARAAEIAVIDGARVFGNGWRLPAGPLREGPSRLAEVDVVVVNRRNDGGELSDRRLPVHPFRVSMQTRLGAVRSLVTNEVRDLGSFAGPLVHAVAGIGNPRSFFDALRAAGLSLDAHALADHAALSPETLHFTDAAAILMTDKDAVKCRGFADHRYWAVALDVQVDRASELINAIERKLLGGCL